MQFLVERAADEYRREEEIERALEKIRQIHEKEKEVVVGNIPYNANALKVAGSLKAHLLAHGVEGDAVVRVQLQLKDGKRVGIAVVLLRDEETLETFMRSKERLSIGDRQLWGKIGTGASKSKREAANKNHLFDIGALEVGLPPANHTSFVVGARFSAECVSTLEISPRRSTISIYFRLGADHYRADYYLRKVRGFKIHLDHQHNTVVLSFRTLECVHLFHRATTGMVDIFNLNNLNTFVSTKENLWELGLDVSEKLGGEWTRTTDPLEPDTELFKHNFAVRVFLKMSLDRAEEENDALLETLCSELRLFNVLRKQITTKVSGLPDCIPLQSGASSGRTADGVTLFIDNTTQEVFESMKLLRLPFEVAYWLHCLVGANKINLIQQSARVIEDLTRFLVSWSADGVTSNLVEVLSRLLLNRKVHFVADLQREIEDRLVRLPDTGFGEAPSPTKQDANYMLIRQVSVTPIRICPQPWQCEPTNRVLRHFSSLRDRFLRVRFVEENFASVRGCARSKDILEHIREIMLKGISVAGYNYTFLSYSNASIREQSCWFFDESPRQIRGFVGDLSGIKLPSLYGARLGQGFSSTISVGKCIEVSVIDDVCREGFCFSDGVGMISMSAASEYAKTLELASIPSAFQVRFGGGKGVMTVMPDEWMRERYGGERDIIFRKSMMKFESPHVEMEINDWSRRKPIYLNRQIIAILATRAVADEVFVALLNEMIGSLDSALRVQEAALDLLSMHTEAGSRRGIVPKYSTAVSVMEMVQSGISIDADPFVSGFLFFLRSGLIKDLFEKARIIVPNGVLLIGVMDETETLEQGEVFVQYSDRHGEVRFPDQDFVIVGRSPSLHCGDIRKLKPRWVAGLQHLVDVVVLPARGDRPHANEMSGGDLDGDIYFVILDERLIPVDDFEPMNFTPAKKPTAATTSISILQVANFFVDYIVNDSLGIIANAHLAWADLELSNRRVGMGKGVDCEKCRELAELHSVAVDFAKTGVPAVMPPNLRTTVSPSYQQGTTKMKYESKSVLGSIHNRVTTLHAQISDVNFHFYSANLDKFALDEDLIVDGREPYLAEARVHLLRYNENLSSLMRLFEITDEMQVLSGYLPAYQRTSKGREESDRIVDQVRAIRCEFAKVFWDEFRPPRAEGGVETKAASRRKASAWYCCTYEQIDQAKRGEAPLLFFSFPWIVSAVLCDIKTQKRAGENFHV